MSSEEYLTIDEVAARLKVSPKTIRNKMCSGIFRKGVHYLSPRGLRPRFKWSAVQAWLEGKKTSQWDGKRKGSSLWHAATSWENRPACADMADRDRAKIL